MLNLLACAFGEGSVHFRELAKANDHWSGDYSEAAAGVAIFEAAKRDADAGVISTIEQKIAGEIFSGFIVSAKEALTSEAKDVAAVLACAALEDALKRFSVLNGLNIDGKTMDSVIGALKGAGLVSGPQKGLLDSMPRIRNAAMHAEWEKISLPDVGSVIGFTEQFLIKNLS